jgi:signal transduction histidine kinase
MKLNINTKIVLLAIVLVVIPAILVGIVGYSAAQTAVYSGSDDRLIDGAYHWKIITDRTLTGITYQEASSRQAAKDIVTSQATTLNAFVQKEIAANGGTLSETQKQNILNTLAKEKVGKTGYIWVLSTDGKYILSKDRVRDGENIWSAQDAKGDYFVQTIVSKGTALKGSEIDYHSYTWLNTGETVPREKISAIINIPQLGGIVGVSTYYDDIIDMKYRNDRLESLKDEMAKQAIGKTGYIWVVDSKGKYVVSKGRLRDGEDISQSQDASGAFFIQDAVRLAKATNAGNPTDITHYPWLNKGETSPRMKAAGISYVPELDWVIGYSAYYDDFQGEGALGVARNTIVIVLIVAVIIGSVAALYFARRISGPLQQMAVAGNRIAEGDLSAEIPDVTTGDEVEDIGITMSMLVGAIKFIRADKEKGGKK